MTLTNSSSALGKNQDQHTDFGSRSHEATPLEIAPHRADKPFVSPIARKVKRALDLSLAAILGLLLLPVFLLIAAAIKCVSRGPILYGQVRIGFDGKPFRMWKFRTMVEDAERRLDEHLMDNPELFEEWNAAFKMSDDPRIIPWLGRFLRRNSLDELPQLWNVLLGEMSLVGPRPLPQYHFDQFDDEFRQLRSTMSPGITGQWQVCSRNDGSTDKFQRWDTYYVRNWSIWLDLQILLRTPLVLISGK